MRPSEVKRGNDVFALDESSWRSDEFWMLVQHDGAVCIHKHRSGEPATESINIPRRTFAAMLEWYDRDQVGDTFAGKKYSAEAQS